MSERSGRAINVAFVLGIAGALLVIAGALLPQISMPGEVTPPLFDISALLADPLAPAIDAGAMVVVFALFAIAFCLVGRYRWLMFCAVMIVLFLSVALTRQLTGVLGLTIQQIIDMYNGVLPPNVDAEALLAKLPVLQATTYGDGLLVLGPGLVLIELAPWLRRLGSADKWQRPAGKAVPAEKPAATRKRREPKAVRVAGKATATVQPAVQGEHQTLADLLLDNLYLFADGLDQPLSFALLDPAGRITRHRMRLVAAGYLGDAYYLRCRDIDAGNLRDVPAHMMSDIVDDLTGTPIDTDDMLQDLARVAYEAVAATGKDDDEPAEAAATTVQDEDERPGDNGEALFHVEAALPEPALPEPALPEPAAPDPAPRGAG